MRVRNFVALALVLSSGAALAQTIYTWTDEHGVQQFTDDPSSIPEKFKKKAKVTGGAEIGVIATEPESSGAAVDRPAAPRTETARPAPEGPNKCVVMKKRVADLEFELAQQKTEYESRQRACAQSGSRVTRTGMVIPAPGCTENDGPAKLKRKLDADERKLETIKDELRVIQIQGC